MRYVRVILKIIRYLTDKNIPLGKKLIFFIPLLYFLFPYDLVFDFFPLVGQLDDIAVLVVLWPFLKNLLEGYQTYADSNVSQNKSGDKEKTVEMNKDDYEVK